MMSKEMFRLSRRKLSRADKYLADMMKADGRPVISAHDLFHFIQCMYAEAKGPSTNYRIGNCRILDGASPLFLAGRQLAISVDARKKGLVGDFSNGGR